jgi:uncharacterized protein YxjI
MSEVKDYCFCSNWDGDGEIYNRDGEVVWRFRTTGLKRRPAEPGLFRSPVFAVSNAGGQELLTISRERMLPLARFRMVENGLPVCTIRQRSILFTKYALEFDNGSRWNLHLPMFTVFIKGVSETGAEVLVRVRSRRQWYVRIGAGFDSLPMMGALAFIIRKKEQCT